MSVVASKESEYTSAEGSMKQSADGDNQFVLEGLSSFEEEEEEEAEGDVERKNARGRTKSDKFDMSEAARNDFYLSDDSDDESAGTNGQSGTNTGGDTNVKTWTDLQGFMADTGRFLQCEKQQVEKLICDAEAEYQENVRGHLSYREQVQRIRDFPLDAQQPYVPISTSTKYTLFRSDNAFRVNMGMAKDHITDMLLYLKRSPTLLALSLQSSMGGYAHCGVELSELIENIMNLFYSTPMEVQYESNPLFKLLAEVLKREILETKRTEDVLKTDTVFVKFIQGFTRMTHFQIFISDSFSVPLAAIIRIKKILKIDPEKITESDLKRELQRYVAQGEQRSQSYQEGQNALLTASGNSDSLAKSPDKALQKGEPRFLSGLFNLFQSQEKRKKPAVEGAIDRQHYAHSLQISADQMTVQQQQNLFDQLSKSAVNPFDVSSISAPSLQNSQQPSAEDIYPVLRLESSELFESQPASEFKLEEVEEEKQNCQVVSEQSMRTFEALKNQKTIEGITGQIIDALTKHVSCIPKGIKVMCKMIMILLNQRDNGLSTAEKYSILSQFLIMRWVVPQLVGLLHCKTSMEMHTLHCQNISIVTKVLQKTFKKDYENFSDNPQLSRFEPFMRSYSDRIDTFFHYLLNFDAGFVENIISRTDAQLFAEQAKNIVSLCLSIADVNNLLKIFSMNTDETIRAAHSTFFAYIQKSIHINEQEKFLDGSKSQESSMFYIWRPAEFVTQSFVDKCMVFEVKDKHNSPHVERVKILNTLISLLRRINPREEMIERKNKEDHELLAILKFYAAQNRLRSKLSTHGFSTKIRASVLLESLPKQSQFTQAISNSLLEELHSSVSKNKKEISESIKLIKCMLQQIFTRTRASTFKLKRETQFMLQRCLKQNTIIFVKAEEIPFKITFTTNNQFTLLPYSQQLQQELLMQMQQQKEHKDPLDFITRSISRLKGSSKRKESSSITVVKMNDNETIYKHFKELSLSNTPIVSLMLDAKIKNCIDNVINNHGSNTFSILTDEIVDKFFTLHQMKFCNRGQLEEDVTLEFQKYISRFLLKRIFRKHQQRTTIEQEMAAAAASITTDSTTPNKQSLSKSAAKKSYDSMLFTTLSAKMQKMTSCNNHVDMLLLIEQCVSELKDIAELDGVSSADDDAAIAVKVAQLLDNSATAPIANQIARLIECFITPKYIQKHPNESKAFTIFKQAVAIIQASASQTQL